MMSFIICSVFAACSDGEGNEPKEVVLKDGAQTSQTIYADETKGKNEGIEFTTTGPWTAEVTEVATRATDNGVDWLKLNQYSGDKAGDYTLTLTLKENLTGVDRKATIKIICNSTVITISVEQKGKKEDGTIPEFLSGKLLSKIQYTTEYDDNNGNESSGKSEISLTYDEQNRVIKISDIDGYGDEYIYTYTYLNNTITEKYKYKTEEGSYKEETEIIYVIDDNNRVASWSSEETEGQNGENRRSYKTKGVTHYDNDGYIMSADVTTESTNGPDDTPSIFNSTDICEWKDGNLVKAGEKDSDRYCTLLEYGNVDNIGNLDLNYFLTRTEWLDCLLFGEAGIKAFGYVGKRSTKLMAKETDLYNNHVYTYEYKPNDDGTIGNVTITELTSTGKVEAKITYTLTYIDAN